MPLSTEDYKSFRITIKTSDDQKATLKINKNIINYSLLDNGHFHADYIPYQDFEDLTQLAKYIIDYLPNVAFGD